MLPQIKTKKKEYTIDYPEAIAFAQQQNSIFWTDDEIKVEKDVQDIMVNMTPAERHGVLTVLKLFTLYELIAGNEYWSGRVKNTFPRPDIERMANCFSFFELNVHAPFYNKLNEALHLNTDEFYSEYTKDKTLSSRMEFIDSYVEDPDDLLSLAVFSMVEGAILYSSFAFLKHFQAQGKNKLLNVVRGINFSVRDECVLPDTEVLTPLGWKTIESLTPTDKVAQFNPLNKEITFVIPDRVISLPYSGDMVQFNSQKSGPIQQTVTPSHRVLHRVAGETDYQFKEAKDLNLSSAKFIPVAGYKKGDQELTSLERFYIATQADGSISDRYTGELVGTRPVIFSFSKKRKLDRLINLLEELGFTYKITKGSSEQGNRKEQTNIKVDLPIECLPETGLKNFDWVNLENVDDVWGAEFIEELSHWDGYTPKDGNYIYYSSTTKSCVDKVQSIACLSGYHGTITKQEDNRSETFNTVHRIYIHNKTEKRCGTITKEEVPFEETEVWCVTVPTGAFVMRENDRVSVTGNCIHAEGGAWLYNQLKKEELELGNLTEKDVKQLERKIIKAAKKLYDHEARIVDMIFAEGKIEGITDHQLKNFVQSRINLCLSKLGIDPIFEVTYNPIKDWFYKNINSIQFHDFFTGIGNQYNRNWDESAFTWKTGEVA